MLAVAAPGRVANHAGGNWQRTTANLTWRHGEFSVHTAEVSNGVIAHEMTNTLLLM